MANIIDYLEWRGDIPFEVSPFGEIDGAVLARVAYLKFEFTRENQNGRKLLDAVEDLLETEEARKAEAGHYDNLFMNALVSSPRFSGMTVLDYTTVMENESQTQYASVTLKDESGKNYVFYRGTDSSILGLKEDFNMSFMTVIPGQIRALEYLKEAMEKYDGSFILGGHSKGGNFSVYASSFLDEKSQERIESVYNYDGPGFEESVIETDGYRRICPRVSSYIPQTSIVGMMLEHEEKYTTVHSSGSGVGQHNIYSWDVKGKSFIRAEGIDSSSRFIDGTLKSWLRNLDREKRGEFIDAVYTVIEKSGIDSMKELRDRWLTSGIKIIKEFRELPPETRKVMKEAMGVLFRSSKESLKDLRK